MPLNVYASPSFARTAKKLHARDKKALDHAVQNIATDPKLGEEKRGDLAGVFVYKFKLNNQETLLAYELRSGPVCLNNFPRFISGLRAGC